MAGCLEAINDSGSLATLMWSVAILHAGVGAAAKRAGWRREKGYAPNYGQDVLSAGFSVSPMLVEQLSVRVLQLLGGFRERDMGKVLSALGSLQLVWVPEQ